MLTSELRTILDGFLENSNKSKNVELKSNSSIDKITNDPTRQEKTKTDIRDRVKITGFERIKLAEKEKEILDNCTNPEKMKEILEEGEKARQANIAKEEEER